MFEETSSVTTKQTHTENVGGVICDINVWGCLGVEKGKNK